MSSFGTQHISIQEGYSRSVFIRDLFPSSSYNYYSNRYEYKPVSYTATPRSSYGLNSASRGIDFSAQSSYGSVTAYGSDSFLIRTLDDNEIEGNETFRYDIRGDDGGTGTVYVTILDNDLGKSGTSQDDNLQGGVGNDVLTGQGGADILNGRDGDDFLHGMNGGDRLIGGAGNDTMRGGHGHDVITGGIGSDWIWGGTGKNTVDAGVSDNARDDIYVPVDSIQNQNGNPDGVNADLLQNLGAEDKIYMHALNGFELTYGNAVFSDQQGVGIYANGSLEALVTGGLSVDQVSGMTTGGSFV